MGGWMTWNRFRNRNGLTWRPDPERSPYPNRDDDRLLWRPRPVNLIVGDLNRLERDCLTPDYRQGIPEHVLERERATNPVERCARETGIDVATVRLVLANLFAQP